MFPQQPQQQFRTAGANVQLFYGTPASSTVDNSSTWNKPVGVSNVYMMLIGAGGGGNGSIGGNSGNVTVWYGAAQNVPDNLIIVSGHGSVSSNAGSASSVQYRGTSIATLLTASGGAVGGSANSSDAATAFASSGFYQNTLGQIGTLNTSQSASATTFLSGGVSSSYTVIANYGYSTTTTNSDGFFLLQPIIVGLGCGGSARAGYGCGAGNNAVSPSGPGFVLIASW